MKNHIKTMEKFLFKDKKTRVCLFGVSIIEHSTTKFCVVTASRLGPGCDVYNFSSREDVDALMSKFRAEYICVSIF
jgi:hypothetical protein